MSPQIDLADGVRLEPLPEWAKDDRAIELLSWQDRRWIKDAEVCFAVEYEAAALGSPAVGLAELRPRSIQSTMVEKFSLASLALWLIRPTVLTAGTVLHFGRRGDPSSVRQVSTQEQILIPEGEEENGLTVDELGEASVILGHLLQLNRKGAVWTAIWTLYPALSARTWITRYMLEWVVAEALLAPSSSGETTFRLAQRIGLFIGESAGEKVELFRKAKDGYVARSTIVHGRQPSKLAEDASLSLSKDLEDIIRRALRKVLLTPGLADIFQSKERDTYLDELAFQST